MTNKWKLVMTEEKEKTKAIASLRSQ